MVRSLEPKLDLLAMLIQQLPDMLDLEPVFVLKDKQIIIYRYRFWRKKKMWRIRLILLRKLPFSVCTAHSVIATAYECNTYKWCQSQWYLQNQPHSQIEQMPLALPKFPYPMNLSASGSVCQHFCDWIWFIRTYCKNDSKPIERCERNFNV